MCLNCDKGVSVNQQWEGNAPFIGCCIVQNGYYCVWDDQAMAMECEEWVELCDFKRVLNEVSHISFQVVAERDRARTALNNLKRDAPFGMCKRFPLGRCYVNISCSTYADMLQRILSALDFKDRETEKEMKYSMKREQDDKDQTARRSYSIDDASTAFRKTMTLLYNALCKRNEVYTRFSFEGKYQFKWCVGECPLPSGGGPSEPPHVPDEPRVGTYGEIMKALDKAGLNYTDFSVFNEEDMKDEQFRCNRETQKLGPTMKNVLYPIGLHKIFVFTSGEYAKCPSAVTGFVFDVTSGTLSEKQVLNPSSSEEIVSIVIDGDLVMVNRGVLDFLQSSAGKSLLSKSKRVQRNHSGECGVASSSRPNINGNWRTRPGSEESSGDIVEIVDGVEGSDSEKE